MGAIRHGPPTELILKLKHVYDVIYFIETGTYRGDTAYWASQHFKQVMTIEASQVLHQEVVERYGRSSNIEFLYGASPKKLNEIISTMNGPGIFWLDAHWSGGDTFGEANECPLVEEIQMINRSAHENFILIDDARLILAPPPHPHKPEHWPNISTVLDLLNEHNNKYIVVVEDVIISVPEFAKSLLVKYCQELNNNMGNESWSSFSTKIKHKVRKILGKN